MYLDSTQKFLTENVNFDYDRVSNKKVNPLFNFGDILHSLLQRSMCKCLFSNIKIGIL